MSHRLPVRVYYEDTDAGGIVYHANYLRFAERARTEWLRELGFDHHDMRRSFGAAFAVRRCEATFLRPARLDDRLEVVTCWQGHQGARMFVTQNVERAGERLVELKLELVLIGDSMRPLRVPAALIDAVGHATNQRGGCV